jgi:alanine racemase
MVGDTLVAAVVKANAYGLGVDAVAPCLFAQGCRHFFVAHTEEGVNLRTILPVEANIYVLHGPSRGEEEYFVRNKLTPVLNNLYQIELWKKFAITSCVKLPAILHVDTGIARLGLNLRQALSLFAEAAEYLPYFDLCYVMSHLSCSGSSSNYQNLRQLKLFSHIVKLLPQVKASLANSEGIFLGAAYHFDLVRPGAALYGLNPTSNPMNPMLNVVSLHAPIIQITVVTKKTKVGYGSRYIAHPGTILATIPVGYADGYMRKISNTGFCYVKDYKLKVVGAVSMDLTIIDVTNLPHDMLYIGQQIELLGEHYGADDLAKAADTIGYEILTGLGNRYNRSVKT